MIDFSEIDVEESLRQGRLVFPQDQAYKHAVHVQSFAVLILIIGPIVVLAKTAAYTLCLLFIFFVIYILFRMLTQLQLTRISTAGTESENKKLLEEYNTKYNYELHHLSSNCIILSDDIFDTYINPANRAYIFLLSGNDIFYCALKSGRTAFPSLFHYWLIRKDIKKLVKKTRRIV